jgi:phage anti-repressor protein
MSELNIVELIENHPISKLTNTYNVKLLDKIKRSFSDAEQQLFIGSFYCYLNYDTKKDFVVDLDNVWKWMGFSQKYNAERILESLFVINIDYKSIAPLNGGAINNTNLLNQVKQKGRGGHNIKKIMMTIKCFKSLCLKAQTKKASEIHEYYLKMEEVLHEVIEEEGTELKQKMEEQKRLLDQKTEELRITPEIEKHRILLKEYGQITGSLVYIVRIKQCDHGKYIIKIGESRKGIKNRFSEFKQKYGNQVLILECFPVHDSAGFEKYLHHHSEIHPHQVKNLEGHEKEQELFLMGGELTYQRLLQIIETGMIPFNNPVVENERLKLENEQLRSTPQPAQIDQSIFQELLKINQLLLQKVQTLEASNKEILSRLNAMQTKTTTVCSQPDPHLGPRLQKIHPETLQILHVYESVTECMKEDHAMKRPSINKAVRENTVYRGFRWQLVDRELDPHAIQTLEPTKVTKVQKNGYVAKVNQEQTEILHVYLDRKTATQCNQYPSIASLDNAVKNHTIKDGYYYQLYEECDALLKNQFQKKHGNVLLYHDGIGQYDANHTLLTEFASKFDCTARAGISQKSLAKVLDRNLMYHEFYFKSLGEKRFV